MSGRKINPNSRRQQRIKEVEKEREELLKMEKMNTLREENEALKRSKE